MQQLVQIDNQRPGRSGRTRVSSLVVVTGLALAACSGSGGGDIGAPSQADDIAEVVDSGPDFVPTPDENPDDGDGSANATGNGPSTTEFDLAAEPSTPLIDPIPETGVPGIDSSDAFCRAWSEFAGSFQALGLVSAIGDPENAYRLEVIAAGSVTTAVEAMEANLPADLEPERVTLITDFAGPFFTRALLAEVDLLGAGLDPDSLREVWLSTLADAGVDDPTLTVEVPAGIDSTALDAAVASFSNAQRAIVDDPTLITTALIPATETYLAEVCPDGGTLSGNDNITN